MAVAMELNFFEVENLLGWENGCCLLVYERIRKGMKAIG